ncbi:MAG: M28 family peptidase [Candidatus Kapaibacteriales bacterium]
MYIKKLKSLLPFFILGTSIAIFSQKASSPEALKVAEYVRYLASDDLEGRFPGTDGNFKATKFIEDKFIRFGLKPFNSSFRQNFPFPKRYVISEKTSMTWNKLIEKPGLPKEMWKLIQKQWVLAKDYQPLAISDNGTVTGDLAFVGYGITAKDLDYDDYAEIDVKGKIVIILIDSAEGQPKDERLIPYSKLSYKALNAREHGAIGIIFVKVQTDSANVFYPLRVSSMVKNSGIVAVQANRTELAKFFPPYANLYPVELEIQKTKKPKSFIIPNTTVTITVELEKEYVDIPNVIGLIPGTDPTLSDEYIVIGAHFDHLGWGTENSLYRGKIPQIHNGADDNASGTSAILYLAEKLSQNPLRRSVIVVAFNAEEEGLLGSSYFVKNPPVDIQKIVFMVNFDMVGRLRGNKLNIFGTGSSTTFDKVVDSIATIDTLELTKGTEGYGPSDHSSFYGAKIPVLFLFTGAHSDYHLPTDDIDKINCDGIIKVAEYSYKILQRYGNSTEKPDYRIVKLDKKDSSNFGSPRYGKVWFGIIPNFEDNPQGLRISGVSPGSPAEKAGLQADDIIIQMGGKKVKNLYDLTYILQEFKPNEIVEVIALRNDKEIRFRVKLVSK